MSRVAVVGGGVAGLVAARHLWGLGHHVTVFEAGDRLGGQIRTEQVVGLPVDVGAEALHLAGPEVVGLVDELGLGPEVVVAMPGSALIWTPRGLRPLPAGVGPAGPTRLGPVLRARVLSPRGLARAACEPLVPRHPRGADVTVGHLLSRRFGHQVTDRLVDPLLGSLHAGDVRRLSARAVAPHLADQADRHRSLLLAQRHRRRGGPPAFASFRGGLRTFSDALLAGTGVEVRLATPVDSVVASDEGLDLRVGPATTGWDGVVLAVPATVAAGILRASTAGAARRLDALEHASVATVVLAYPRPAVADVDALAATGLLVPSTAGRLLKAATFLSTKWPHLADGEHVLVRLSAGRAGSTAVADRDDDELVQGLRSDLADITGLGAEPVARHVRRWPRALTQLEVGHLERMREVRAEVDRLPGLVLAGASYDGLGLSSCLRSGRAAADRLGRHLASAAPQTAAPRPVREDSRP